MISGIFRDGHPRLELEVLGIDGPARIEFIVDTGFEGYLTVPASLAFRLSAGPYRDTIRSMADGSDLECPAFDLSFTWNGEERVVEVIILAGKPLLGTELLEGCSLHVDIWHGGPVEIEMPG